MCGRGEGDRDIPEAREAGELGRRQPRQPVIVQIEGPVGNTHEQAARARGVAGGGVVADDYPLNPLWPSG